MYVFSLTWGATLCEENTECKDKLKKIPKNIFTLHGLWPNYRDGRKIEECNKGTPINVNITEESLHNDMTTFWLSLTSNNQYFWNHEYNKHGYCYSYRYKEEPDNFFKKSMNLYKQHSFDKLMLRAIGYSNEKMFGYDEKMFGYDELMRMFKKVYPDLIFDIDCKKIKDKTYLSEVRFYFDLNMKPIEYMRSSDCKNETIYIILE
jgi:ribonuclease I